MSEHYLATGLPQPEPSELDQPYWQGLRENILRLQRCLDCQGWQWGPEYICHHCHGDQLEFTQVEPVGEIYSYERVWHPVHPALTEQGAYIVVLVAIPAAGHVRLVGNLLGDAQQPVTIGARVEGVFEHHEESQPAFTLLQWQLT